MTNRTAIVTGAAGGLGQELIRSFHENGWRVCINYHTVLGRTADIVEEMGDSVLAIKADVCSFTELFGMAEEVHRRWGRIDALVNNAAITGDSLLVRQREEDWDSVLEVNLKGPFLAVRACVPFMSDGGHVVNISSYSGLKGKEGQAAYSASKAALLGLTKTAALELADRRIRVNAVLPGYLATAMGSGSRDAMERARRESLLNTLSDPREAAGFIVWLTGTENITGQVFCLDSRII